MDATRIFMLGRFDIWCNEERLTAETSQKACELVAYLLVFRQAPHHRDRLAALLVGRRLPHTARTYLRKALWQIQSALPAERAMLSVETEWIEALQGVDCWLDLAEFERAYEATRGLEGQSLTDEARRRLQAAVALYRGDLLDGWYQDWCLLERERLLRMNLIMLDKLVAFALAHGDFETGIAYANQLLRWDRARERTHYDLMRLYAMAGERTAVLNQFELCRAILHEELGVAPATKTVALDHAVRNQIDPVAGLPHSETDSKNDSKNDSKTDRALDLTEVLQTLDHLAQQIAHLQQSVRRELAD